MTTSLLINKLQALKTHNSYVFTKNASGIDISKTLVLKDILFRKRARFIGYASHENLPFEICDRIEAFDCYAYQKSYTKLGVIFLELLFSNKSYVEINILNKQSEIRQFFIYVNRENNSELLPFLKVDQKETYKSFTYFSTNIDKYPFAHHFDNDNLPTFSFSCSNYQDIHTENRIKKADQLILSTSISGLILTAELFLNIGRTDNKQPEICLENPLYGVGGVSQKSVEARFWLPNSFGFYTDKIDELIF